MTMNDEARVQPSHGKRRTLAQLREDDMAMANGTAATDGEQVEPVGSAPPLCVHCGGAIADVLARLGSTRCHDCRRVEAAPSARLGPAH
jgi:hypothetical protein